jgi:hypothetical protein
VLRREGWRINQKKTRRLYRELGLATGGGLDSLNALRVGNIKMKKWILALKEKKLVKDIILSHIKIKF